MENFLLGFRALFKVWGNRFFASKVRELLQAPLEQSAPAAPPASAAQEVPVPPPALVVAPERASLPTRSDALTLLAVLQREARLIDFLQEPISEYTDAQIGAAVRGIHKDSAAVLKRLFALECLRTESEGSMLEIPREFDPALFRLIGNLPERPPFHGKLSHPGWKATRCEMPQWSGREEAALVVAPCEVELK